MGLENNVPHSFVNPILQLCYALTPLRDRALQAQLSPFHYQDAHQQGSLLAEVGFLFHMLLGVQDHCQRSNGSSSSSSVVVATVDTATDADAVEAPGSCAGAAAEASAPQQMDKMVRAANFQRIYQTYRLAPEAAALGLFEESMQSDLQQFIQVFAPFLLRQLGGEMEREHAYNANISASSSTAQGGGSSKRGGQRSASPALPKSVGATAAGNVVDELMGFSSRSTTTFLHSGVHKVDPATNRALVLDLLYPSLAPSTSGGKKSSSSPMPLRDAASSTSHEGSVELLRSRYKVTGAKGRSGVSFAATLWGSFQKEAFMKGWCKESEAFEPFKKVQSIVSLPRVLTLLCGNTDVDVKDSTTLAGAIGETIGRGSTHSNFWGYPMTVSLRAAAAAASAAAPSVEGGEGVLGAGPVDLLAGLSSRGFAWLPVEVEIASKEETVTAGAAATTSPTAAAAAAGKGGLHISVAPICRFVVSCRCIPLGEQNPNSSRLSSDTSIWIVFDGVDEFVSDRPASQCGEYEFSSSSTASVDTSIGGWSIVRYNLLAVVPQVTAGDRKHLVLHLNKGVSTGAVEELGPSDQGATKSSSEWYLFNDFHVKKVEDVEVVSFPAWKHPCMVCFEQQELKITNETSGTKSAPAVLASDSLVVPESVLMLESLSHTPSIRLLQSFATLPGPGDLIAFDGEFVSVSVERSHINAAGERIVSEEVRQVLARISLLDTGRNAKDVETELLGAADALSQGPAAGNSTSEGGGSSAVNSAFNKNNMRILADDYILPVEPVLDYVTRFSGITAEDLNPNTSQHSLLTQRAAYLKLRYFIDRKCIFVGHGLQKDFETANIFIPPEQIRDTVELWRLPNQRYISLRFLASYVLKEDIQDEIHDSIEDAKTALLLYHQYHALTTLGPEKVKNALFDLYVYGNRNNWTIGMDRLGK